VASAVTAIVPLRVVRAAITVARGESVRIPA
jgi:hypothetical protein